MIIFYSNSIENNLCRFSEEESFHMIKVLRHKAGDKIICSDGEGNGYSCTIICDNAKSATAKIDEKSNLLNIPSYNLTIAVALTKNTERFEWFVEKAVEIGISRIVPINSVHSERRTIKKERLEKIVLSAMKQSLKAFKPKVDDITDISEFMKETSGSTTLKMIAHCGDNRSSMKQVLADSHEKNITVLIGPEGDFSQEEIDCALTAGFIPVHLGTSRLRTETAALTAVTHIYINFM